MLSPVRQLESLHVHMLEEAENLWFTAKFQKEMRV